METVLAPNGYCRLWTGYAITGKEECLYGRVFVRVLHGDRYKWQGLRVQRLVHMWHVRAELPENVHCSHRCHNSLCVNVEHPTIEPVFVNSNRLQKEMLWTL